MKEKTCCLLGHGPHALPWGTDEGDPRCVQLKTRMREVLERLIAECGVRYFITGMSLGAQTYAAEQVLALKERWPHIMLECALPYEEQHAHWHAADRERYFSIVEQCDRENLLQRRYTPDCPARCCRDMVERSGHALVVWDGGPGGAERAASCAYGRGLEVIVLKPLERLLQVVP